MRMPLRVAEVIKQASQARRLTLRRLADRVMKDDATPISAQSLLDIEVHHRVPAPHVLRELARVLALDYDTLLGFAGAADVVVRENLQRHLEAEAAVIKLWRAAQAQEVSGLGSSVATRAAYSALQKVRARGVSACLERVFSAGRKR
jgi:transcriptional regulator with XRE-family HTH domain